MAVIVRPEVQPGGQEVVYRIPKKLGLGRPVPLGGFLLALVVLGVVLFAMPEKARPWFALLIVMGAVIAQGGAAPVEEIRKKVFGQ